MAKKAIVKLLTAALKNVNKQEALALIGISADEFDLLVDGSMEFSPLLAKQFGEALALDPRAILAAQADDQLTALGVEAKPLEKVTVSAEAQKDTRTDGRPSQSPMHRTPSGGVISMTMRGITDEQANKAVRAMMDSFAD